jgi:hypothetical protein
LAPAAAVKGLPVSPLASEKPAKASTEKKDYDSNDYAAAWETLQVRPLSGSERWHLQKELLEAWSLVDVQAALAASLRENRRSMISAFGGPQDTDCKAGIAANADLVWELIQQRAFGLETAIVRSEWLEVMWEKSPARIYDVLPGLQEHDRKSVLEDISGALASNWENADNRQEILSHVLPSYHSATGKTDLRAIAAHLGMRLPLSHLETQREQTTDEAGRFLYTVACAVALTELDNEEFLKVWDAFDPSDRSLFAREALYADEWCDQKTFEFAKLALTDGNLDALRAATRSFGRFADNTEQPVELAEWALTLPHDPRTLELYRTSLGGAAVRDFPAVREKILALPPGWQRDHGIAALAYGGHYSDQSVEEIERLLERIQDPEVQERAKKDYLERRLKDEQ